MTQQELITFSELAGRRSPPNEAGARTLWIVASRRARKDSIASLATYAATIEQAHVGRLRPGEQAVVKCLALDRDQSRIVTNYVRVL